ncbi:MAG TPA: hypothetical protein VFW83_05590, partial [Bryobacteraceae bacterium]|nr:hypothetical protein [Bryobacteraceae bacterium]
MPTTINLDRTLDSGELEFLCGVARPCITLLLAPYKPGEPTPPDWVQIRQLIRGSAELPEMRALGKEAEPLLAPLLYLEDQPELEKGGKGLAVFSAPGFVSAYRSDSIAGQRIVVSARAYIKPLLAETLAPREIFILGLSRKHLRLLRYRMGKCEEMPLPAGVPASVNEAVALDKPDHNFQNQVSAGPSTGDISGVRFGTGSDRETAPEYLHQFFTLVDQGLQP